MCGTAVSVVSKDGMSRAPVVRFRHASRAHEAKVWLEDDDNYALIMDAFSSTSRLLLLNCTLIIEFEVEI